MSRTPCVLRPMVGMPSTGMRISLPPSVISIRSSSSVTRRRLDHLAVALGGLDGDDALAAAVLGRVVGGRRALAVALLADGEQRRRLLARDDGHADDLVVADSPARRRMPRTPRAVRPIGRTFSSRKRIAQPLRVPSRMSDAPSVMRTLTRSSSSAMVSAMMPELRMLANASSDVFLIWPSRVAITTNAPSENSRTGRSATTRSPSCSGIRLTNALPLAVRPGLRDLPHLLRVGAPLVGEHQQHVVRRRDEQLRDEVFLVRRGAGDAAPAAPLRPVQGLGVALDVAAVGDGDHHLLGRDHVLDVDVAASIVDDLGAALVAVLLLDLLELRRPRPT